MVRMTVKVCDVCEDKTKDTQEYTVSTTGRRAKVDLCVDDAAGVEALLPPPSSEPTAAKTPARGSRRRVTSMEEVESRKQK